jgi:hypothetical protein
MERDLDSVSTWQYVAPKIASSRRVASRHLVKLPVGRVAGFLDSARNDDCLLRKFAA